MARYTYDQSCCDECHRVESFGEEGYPHLHLDERIQKVDDWNSYPPCKHCTAKDGWWVCPRAIISTNQGGHDSTTVCYDCIKEAVEA